jgi:GrpB-like predicted nucleotidyltransferase (UPF0157 family)
MIAIETYDPRWPAEFIRIRAELQDLLGSLALRIDHIGSTSVPGLGAKDVIDIQITVTELTLEIRDFIIDAGYHYSAEHTHDHVPLGEDAEPRLWEKFAFSQPAGQRRANIHVRVQGNPNQRYALLFRDYLRTHPISASTIERIKRELVKQVGDDIEAYYDIKDPVYDLVWAAAQEWAAQTGWNP